MIERIRSESNRFQARFLRDRLIRYAETCRRRQRPRLSRVGDEGIKFRAVVVAGSSSREFHRGVLKCCAKKKKKNTLPSINLNTRRDYANNVCLREHSAYACLCYEFSVVNLRELYYFTAKTDLSIVDRVNR